MVVAPAMSKEPLLTTIGSLIRNTVRIVRATKNGTTTWNASYQWPTEVMYPPPSRPSETPTENMALTVPMAVGILSLGNVSRMMPKANGNMPIPMPWTPRKKIRTKIEGCPNSARICPARTRCRAVRRYRCT